MNAQDVSSLVQANSVLAPVRAGQGLSGEELEERVSLDDVRKALLQQQLGHADGLVGRVAICTSERFSTALGIAPEKALEARAILKKVEASLLKQVAQRTADAQAKREAVRRERVRTDPVTTSIAGPEGAGDKDTGTGDARKKPRRINGLDELIADVKEQMLFAETELEGLLTASQYRKMIAIQSHVQDAKAIADPVIAKFCGVDDRGLQSLRRLKKRFDEDTARLAYQAKSKSEGDAFMEYLDRVDQFEGAIWKALSDKSERKFRKIMAEGESLCADPSMKTK